VGAIKNIGDTIGGCRKFLRPSPLPLKNNVRRRSSSKSPVQQAAQGSIQVTSNIADVQRGASDTGSASSQVLSTAQSLSSESNRLKLEIGKFLDAVRAA
jgi:methyl-accepting chemotaxis protein